MLETAIAQSQTQESNGSTMLTGKSAIHLPTKDATAMEIVLQVQTNVKTSAKRVRWGLIEYTKFILIFTLIFRRIQIRCDS